MFVHACLKERQNTPRDGPANGDKDRRKETQTHTHTLTTTDRNASNNTNNEMIHYKVVYTYGYIEKGKQTHVNAFVTATYMCKSICNH